MPQSTRTVLAVVATASVVLLCSLGLAGPTSAAGAKSLTLKPRYTRIVGTTRGTSVMATKRYLLARTGTGHPLLIDDQTGRSQRLTLPAGCRPTALNNTDAVLFCSATDQTELYDLATAHTSQLVINRPADCSDVGITCPAVYSIGSHWAALLRVDTDNDHNPDTYEYQNLATGQLVAQPQTGNLAVDLDSATLPAQPCAPLKVPIPDEGDTLIVGSLTPVGNGFQIAAGARTWLERCGTKLHVPLETSANGPVTTTRTTAQGCPAEYCPPANNRRSIVWATQAPNRSIRGIFLPSLRRFTLSVPKGAGPRLRVGLTSKHLYVTGGRNLWMAPAPRSPKP